MRIDYRAHTRIREAMSGLAAATREVPIESELLELVRIRSSQINRCAFCLDMHTKDALAHGESDQRLHLVAAWGEAPLFSARERAALEWCEELSELPGRDVPDELYERVRAVFSEDELVSLTLAIVTINGWNRIAVAFRAPVGDYVARTDPAARR